MTSQKTVADSTVSSSSHAPEEAQKSGAAALRKLATHPSTAVMVKEALTELDSRKGVSSQAIQSYIKQKYPSVDVVRLKHLVRRALIKGMETGTLVRPANSTVTTGATGKFRLAPKVKEAKPKTENLDPNVQKEPKGAKTGTKKPPKTGAKKKESANEEAKSKEESKPPKKSKKEEAAASGAAPPKKPKAKKAVKMEDDEGASDSAQTETAKAGKTSQRRAAKTGSDAPPAAKTKGKVGKKAM